MSDLRERLVRLFACRCDPAWTERRLHAPDCVEELGDDAIDEVAAWLRDEAAALMIKAHETRIDEAILMLSDQARVVERLAASLARPDHDPESESLDTTRTSG